MRANYIHEDYRIETLVRTEKISVEAGDAFKGFQTGGMSDVEIIIFLWTKHFRICRLLFIPSLNEMADPKVASISTIYTFEQGKPVKYDYAILMIHHLFSENGCESCLHKAMELITYAKLAKCNVDVILSQDGTNRRASKPIRIFSISKNENNTTTEEQDEEGQYWDEQDWEKQDSDKQIAGKQGEKNVPTVRKKNPGPKPLL
ncbi:MAG TPA: hypothetical protein VIK78_14365 [Ruminiclostridium sp.]